MWFKGVLSSWLILAQELTLGAIGLFRLLFGLPQFLLDPLLFPQQITKFPLQQLDGLEDRGEGMRRITEPDPRNSPPRLSNSAPLKI